MDSDSGSRRWCLHSSSHPQSSDWHRFSQRGETTVTEKRERQFRRAGLVHSVGITSRNVSLAPQWSSWAPLVPGTICLKRFKDSCLSSSSGHCQLMWLELMWPCWWKVLLKKVTLPLWLSLFIQSEATTCFSIPDLTTRVFPPHVLPIFAQITVRMKKDDCLPPVEFRGRFLTQFIEKPKLNRKKIESKYSKTIV